MRKIGRILSNIEEKPLQFSFIYIIVFAIISFILSKINIAFRQIPNIIIMTIPLLIIFYGIVKKMKENDTFRNIVFTILILGVILCIIFGKFLILMGALLYGSIFPIEHVVSEQGEKYVVYVENVWMRTYVHYHKYINPIFCKYNQEFQRDLRGAFDPYDENHEGYFDDKKDNNTSGNTEETLKPSKPKEKPKAEIQSDNEILYQEKFGDITVMAICKGDAMGNHIVAIYNSYDDGETWKSIIDNEEGVINVHYGTEFIFFNENLGYYFDPGRAGTNLQNQYLFVTTNGGKTFDNVNLKDINGLENPFYLEGLPYSENGVYKLKVYNYLNGEEVYHILNSQNGIEWYFEKKK